MREACTVFVLLKLKLFYLKFARNLFVNIMLLLELFDSYRRTFK